MKCPLCKREGNEDLFEKHHLIPQNKKSKTVFLCRQCHRQIHLMFTNGELKREFNTIGALQLSERMVRYIKWVQSKPTESSFTVATKKKRR